MQSKGIVPADKNLFKLQWRTQIKSALVLFFSKNGVMLSGPQALLVAI